MTLRAGLARQWPESGLSLHLVIKATARALQEHPRMNAVQKEHEVELVPEIHIGVAVRAWRGAPWCPRSSGPMPTSGSDRQRIPTCCAKREGRATYEEVTGGTFTITNLGAYEIDAFTPIINPPQVGILGVGRRSRSRWSIRERSPSGR